MARSDVKILCSLGVSNIKNYLPIKGERVLIAADNDGPLSSSLLAITKAKEALEEKGAIVNIVMPKKAGDFNDVLREHGREEVRSQILSGLNELEQVKSNSKAREKKYENGHEQKQEVNHEVRGKDSVNDEYRNKVDVIRQLRPNYDINLLKKEVLSLPTASEQKACIDRVYFEVLEEKIASVFKWPKRSNDSKANDDIENNRADTKLVRKLEEIDGHVSVMKERNINAGEKIVDLLKSGSGSFKDAKHLEDMLFARCQAHIMSEVKDDLYHIRDHKFIEKTGRIFEHHRSYLEHIMHDKETSHYLSGTKIEHEFIKMSKGTRMVRQQDHIKAHEQTKTHEKDYGMGM